MPKNILIINSLSDSNKCLINLFEELRQKDYLFYLLSSKHDLTEQFKLKQWSEKKIYLGPNILNSKINSFLFLILLPLLFFAYLIYFAYYKYKKKITSIICLGWNEKIIFTLISKIIKTKIIWIEFPDANYNSIAEPLVWLYKINSKWADIICFTSFTKMQLKKIKVKDKKIKIIHPGIILNRFEYQDTIFNKLAHANKSGFQRKYFTVGVIADLNRQQKIEALLKATKHCLTVIPNLQLIIVGGGKERKNLAWLAKKMEIDNIVWFVGKQNRIKKWLESFDIFVSVGENPSIADIITCLHAMSAGLPIVCQKNIGLEYIIRENKNGSLTEIGSSKALAQQIINLQQNKRLRLNFGKNSIELVEKNFLIKTMAEKFEELIL